MQYELLESNILTRKYEKSLLDECFIVLIRESTFKTPLAGDLMQYLSKHYECVGLHMINESTIDTLPSNCLEHFKYAYSSMFNSIYVDDMASSVAKIGGLVMIM